MTCNSLGVANVVGCELSVGSNLMAGCLTEGILSWDLWYWIILSKKNQIYAINWTYL